MAVIRELPGPGLKMDSTACLVGSDALHVKLAFQLLPAGPNNMQENNPIPRHRKREVSLVAARFDLR